MNKKTKHLIRATALATSLFAAGGAHALTLPTVTNCGYDGDLANLMCYTTETGAQVYIASAHDDFISYSVNAMQELTNSFGYSSLSAWSTLPSFGTGQIVKLFGFNEGNNDPFPDATVGTGDNNTGDDADQTPRNDGNYMGEWPVEAVVTVGQLQAFLGSNLFTPVFSFDLNNRANLSLNGQLQVLRNGVTEDTFAFDNVFNSAYDEDSKVLAQATVPVTWYDPQNTSAGCGLTIEGVEGFCSMEVKNNVGSGKPDFFAYAPSFDLRNYEATDTLYFQLRMWGLDSGGEELAFTNIISTPVTPPASQVPEPGVLALLGLGLLGLGAVRRKSPR